MRRLRQIAAAFVAAATVAAARRAFLRWRARPDEVEAELAGDDLIASPDLSATRAITIDAPAARVWPWLAQMGQGRGGLYSYDRLENLIGCQIHSADRVVEEWQRVEVGDAFRLHPAVALQVAVVDPPSALVVLADDPAAPYSFSWAFVVADDGPGRSRLLIRERYRYRARWSALVVEPLSVGSWFMTQRMLRGIRDRAVAGR